MYVARFQWRSLKARVTLTTLVILLLAIWSLALYVSKSLRVDMQRLLGEQQQATVALVAAAVNSDFEERFGFLNGLALSINSGLLNDPASLQQLLQQRPAIQVLFNAGVFVTRIDGTAIAEFPPIGRLGLNYLDRDHVAAALTGGKASVGKPTIGKRVQAASFAITVPILGTQGNVLGAIVGATDLSKPNFLDDLNQSRYGETGGYLMVDPGSRQFVVATANNKRLVMQPLPAPGINAVLDRRLEGFDGSAVNLSSQGVEVLTSSARIPLAGWFVISNLPTEEAFAPIRNMLQRIRIATILLTLIAAFLAWWALKRQLSPLTKAIKTLSNLSESGEGPVPFSITRNDEIGDLLTAFNRLLRTLGDRDRALHQSEERFRHFFEKNSSVQLLIEPNSGHIEDANLAAVAYYGYPRNHLIGMLISDINTLSPERIAEERILALQESRKYFQFEHRLASGELRNVEVHSTPIESDCRTLLLSIVHDVTERKLAQEQLRQSNLEQKAILNSNIAGIVKLQDRHFVWMNNSFAAMLGYSVSELVGKPTKIVYKGDQSYTNFAIEAYPALQRGENFRKEMQYLRKDGTLGWFDISGDKISTDSAASIWSFLDITEKKNANAQMLRLIAEQKALLNNDLIGIVTTQDRIIAWANPAFEHMMGFNPGELEGMPTRMNYLTEEAHQEFVAAAMPVLLDGKVFRTQLEHIRKDGRHIWLDVSGSMLSPESREILWCFSDVTERRRNEQEIKQLAFYDTLTALPNRRLLQDRLSQAMTANKRNERHGAVMFLDLDNFKPLNDAHGHNVGDLLLLEVAARLKSCVRQIDTISRFGGDEFVVLLGDLAADKAESTELARVIAEEIRATLAEPYFLSVELHGHASNTVEHRCTASIGVKIFSGQSHSQDEILKSADAAMYLAKDAGRNTIRFDGECVRTPPGAACI